MKNTGPNKKYIKFLDFTQKLLDLYFKALTRKIFNNKKSNKNKKAKGKDFNFGQTVLLKVIKFNIYVLKQNGITEHILKVISSILSSHSDYKCCGEVFSIEHHYLLVASECTQDTQIYYFVLILIYSIFGD